MEVMIMTVSFPEEAAAHRGLGLVENVQKGELFIAVEANGLGQLKIMPRRCVKAHILAADDANDALDVLEGILLGLLKVSKQRAGSGSIEAVVGKAVARKRGHAEMRAQALLGTLDIEGARVGLLNVEPALDALLKKLILEDGFVNDHLSWRDANQLVEQIRVRIPAVYDHRVEFARGNVAVSKPEGRAARALFDGNTRDKAVLLVVEHLLLDNGAGRYDPYDVALDKALRKRGIGQLFADGDLIALFDKARYIGVYGMIRYAAHRGALLKAAVPAGQGQLKLLRGSQCVVEEHLIEVAETEEQQAVAVLLLHLEILLHHRSKTRHFIPLLP